MAKPIKMEIDYETADGITKLNLKDAYGYMKKEAKEIKKRIKEGTSYPAQAEDLAYNERMMIHIKEVLSYYGETV
jgi:hypothetical protein